MGLEAIPPISPRSRWEPPLAPGEVKDAAGERDTAGGAYSRNRRRKPRPGPDAQPPAAPPADDEQPPGGHHIDVRA